jgi:hypothetical protein
VVYWKTFPIFFKYQFHYGGLRSLLFFHIHIGFFRYFKFRNTGQLLSDLLIGQPTSILTAKQTIRKNFPTIRNCVFPAVVSFLNKSFKELPLKVCQLCHRIKTYLLFTQVKATPRPKRPKRGVKAPLFHPWAGVVSPP